MTDSNLMAEVCIAHRDPGCLACSAENDDLWVHPRDLPCDEHDWYAFDQDSQTVWWACSRLTCGAKKTTPNVDADAALAAVRAALADYKAALERREHGGVAAVRFIEAVSAAVIEELP